MATIPKTGRSMKPMLLSRTEADHRFRASLTPSTRTTLTPRKTPPRVSHIQSLTEDYGYSAIAATLQRQTEMFETMMNKIMETSSNTITQVIKAIGTGNTTQGVTMDSGPEIAEADSSSSKQDMDCDPEIMDVPPHLTNEVSLTFDAVTTGAEPSIPLASEAMVKKGVDCQRLGTPAWNNLTYREVEKSLQSTPIFTALKTNPQMASSMPKWCSADILSKFDQTCGVLTHALLLMREDFEKGVQKVVQEVGGSVIAESIQRNLLSKESDYRRRSDQAMQYVCGRRADVFATRRSFYKSPNIGLDGLLQSIPPSVTHLYDEKKLTKFLNKNGGYINFLPAKKYKRPGKNVDRTRRQNQRDPANTAGTRKPRQQFIKKKTDPKKDNNRGKKN